MDTALEALFRAMLTNDWFINSDGNVEAPTGYFGYVYNNLSELPEIYEAFSDVIEGYGKPDDEDIVGSFYASIDSNGIIHIVSFATQSQAKSAFDMALSEYIKWSDSDPEDA